MLTETEDTICIVPAFMFDKSGYRLGYGKGYYDRYLADFKGEIIRLAFTEQNYILIPIEPHDVRMDKVITERGILSKPNF